MRNKLIENYFLNQRKFKPEAKHFGGFEMIRLTSEQTYILIDKTTSNYLLCFVTD